MASPEGQEFYALRHTHLKLAVDTFIVTEFNSSPKPNPTASDALKHIRLPQA